jgi:hypothetical protein
MSTMSEKPTAKRDLLSFSAAGALSLVLAFNLLRLLWFDSGDLHKCHALLNDGDWLDAGHTNWQPAGALRWNASI